jgi:hypothetical protein
VEPTGDVVTPLVRALDDPTVAVVGAWGSVTGDLRHWQEAPTGDVDAVDGRACAFRREDLITRGPLDERYRTGRHLAAWWSLVLRDAGEGSEPRRAVAIRGLPVVRHGPGEEPSVAPEALARLEKRDFYRLLDHFGRRPDLRSGGRGG